MIFLSPLGFTEGVTGKVSFFNGLAVLVLILVVSGVGLFVIVMFGLFSKTVEIFGLFSIVLFFFGLCTGLFW